MAYGLGAGSSIGSLLRFIQEQKTNTPPQPAGTEVGSPIRGMVQEPLKAPEAQDTSRVVSLRPEGISPGEGVEKNPAVSRVGPMSIGGGEVKTPPISAVAANEPGPGMSIPSATKSVGDVLNKTGAAQPPNIATKISSSVPTTLAGNKVKETTRGQEVGNYALRDKQAEADKNYGFVKEAISRSERSFSETLANNEKEYIDAMQNIQELDKKEQEILRSNIEKQNTSGTPENLRLLASVRSDLQKIKNNPYYPTPTPTPTPMPTQGGGSSSGGSGGSSGGSGGGQVKGVSTPSKPIIMSSAKQSIPTIAPKVLPNIINTSTGMQSVRKVKQYNPATGQYYYITI